MKKNKKEELQSRRQFFKKAAMGALPILGAIVAANIPVIAKAKELTSDCYYGCAGSCNIGCVGQCHGTCKFTCAGSCVGNCFGYCSGGAKFG